VNEVGWRWLAVGVVTYNADLHRYKAGGRAASLVSGLGKLADDFSGPDTDRTSTFTGSPLPYPCSLLDDYAQNDQPQEAAAEIQPETRIPAGQLDNGFLAGFHGRDFLGVT
jgi:hypothetical protein